MGLTRQHVLALDIGGTKADGSVFEIWSEGALPALLPGTRDEVHTDYFRKPEDFLEWFQHPTRRWAAMLPTCAGWSVAVAGPVTASGRIGHSPNVPFARN